MIFYPWDAADNSSMDRHPGESWDLTSCCVERKEIPAFAGMTSDFT
jgi:hypothetical protein